MILGSRDFVDEIKASFLKNRRPERQLPDSGLKLKKLGRRYGISESGVTQASRRVRLKIEDDKKFARMITKIAKYVNV